MATKILLSKDALVEPAFISGDNLVSEKISFYRHNSGDVVGVENNNGIITFYVYPFTNEVGLPTDGFPEEILNSNNIRFLYNIKRKKILTKEDFSEFISLKYSESVEYPIFLLGDETKVRYIQGPLPQELFALNIIAHAPKLRGGIPTTTQGKTLLAFLSAQDLGIKFTFDTLYGVWNSPNYKTGERKIFQEDLNPLREFISKLDLNTATIKTPDDVSNDTGIFLTELLTISSGVPSLFADICGNEEIIIDIHQDIFKKIFLTDGGLLIQLQPGCKTELEELIAMFGTDMVTLVSENLDESEEK